MIQKCRGCDIYVSNDTGLCNACKTRLSQEIGIPDYSDIFDATRPDAARCEFRNLKEHRVIFRIGELEDDISEVKSIDGSAWGKRAYANEGIYREEDERIYRGEEDEYTEGNSGEHNDIHPEET